MITLESADLAQARQYFDRTRNRVAEATRGLSSAQWHFKPAPGRWSIAENLEHMLIAQERLLGPVRERLAQAPPPPPDHDARKIDALLLAKIPDRSVRANAPEFALPTGTWIPRAALERHQRNYERLLEFVESTPDLREHGIESPPLRFLTGGALTIMDGYQWALTIAAHDERHVRQMEEVKADPGYPGA